MLFLKQKTSQLKVTRTGIFHERVAKIRPSLLILTLATLVIWLGPLPIANAGDDQLRYQRFMAEQNRYGKPRPRTGDRESGYAAEHMIRNNLWFVDELKKRDADFGLEYPQPEPMSVKMGVMMSRRTGDKYSRM